MRIIPIPLTEKPSPQVKVYSPVARLIVKELPLPPKSITVRVCAAKVTLKLQTKSSPPQRSGAVQVTTVVPRGKTDPKGGEHIAVIPALVTGVVYVTAVGTPL